MLTCKPLSNSLVADETAVSVIGVTFSESLIDGAQVQVDSIIQVALCNLQVDSVMQIGCQSRTLSSLTEQSFLYATETPRKTCNGALVMPCESEIAPFYFYNNFVKPSSILIIFGTNILQ